MRLFARLFSVLVIVLVSSAVLAQVDRPILNLDPETNVSVMSDSMSVMRTRPITFVPIGPRAVPQVEPPVTLAPCEGVATVWASGRVGTTDLFKVSHLFRTYLPQGTEISHWVKKPDGTIFFYESVVLSVGGTHWQGWVYNNPLPADYPAGISQFGSTAKIGAWKCSVVAPVAIGLVFPADGSPQLGPLESFKVDSMGGVRLFGVFKTPVIVVAAPLPEIVPLEGWDYIPPGAVNAGEKVTTICSGLNGNPFYLECTTETIPFPPVF